MATIFADTTVLADLMFAPPEEQDALRVGLAGHCVWTTRYVIQELRCTFLRDAVVLYDLVVDSDTTEIALRRLTRRYLSERRLRRVHAVLALVSERTGSCLDRKTVLERLEALIEFGLMAELLAPVEVDGITDETGCVRGEPEPEWRGNRFDFECRCSKREPTDCRIEEFHERHADELGRLAQGPDDLDAVHKRLRETAAAVLEDGSQGRGTNCYRILSDCIIAMCAPADAAVCSTNAKDFCPICEALGKEFLDGRPGRQSG